MIDVVEKIRMSRMKEARNEPCNTNRASVLGHPCVRYLYHCRADWDRRQPVTEKLAYLFHEGHEQEERVLKAMRNAGIDVSREGESFEWKKYQITGHIDCMIRYGRKELPVEIKSMAPTLFPSVNSVDDMYNHPRFWIRHYPAQLTVYMMLTEKEEGMFLLKNKSSGELKQLDFMLDFDFARDLIEKAEAVNAAIETDAPPEPMSWHDDYCPECEFKILCSIRRPNFVTTKGIDKNRLSKLLAEREQLMPERKLYTAQFKVVEKAIREMVEGHPKIILPPWKIETKQVIRGPIRTKQTSYWKVNIRKIERE